MLLPGVRVPTGVLRRMNWSTRLLGVFCRREAVSFGSYAFRNHSIWLENDEKEVASAEARYTALTHVRWSSCFTALE
jgi:hypothetical protein